MGLNLGGSSEEGVMTVGLVERKSELETVLASAVKKIRDLLNEHPNQTIWMGCCDQCGWHYIGRAASPNCEKCGNGIDTAYLEYLWDLGESQCVICGCSDLNACMCCDGPCSWIVVNQESMLGICSACEPDVGAVN